MNFKYGPLISCITIGLASCFTVFKRLRNDVQTAGNGTDAAEHTNFLPLRSDSIYAAHRQLLPASRMRKAFGFIVFSFLFTTLLSALFLVLGV
jgi:hypothetical protein